MGTGERRKTVTVLFCDVTGSTALGERLDPESLRAVMARYFDMARIVVERHGGSVEKFIGDAVMAVFGIPVLHEDDALRAVRAAAEVRDGLTGLNVGLERDFGTTLELRIGVNTGEVVTGTEERLATGDAVNVAARLEATARPGEILLGTETHALVRESVVVEEMEPLELKGKAAPVAAFRLVSVRAETPSRRLSGVMVGRERELGRLQATMAQAVADGSCQLFTVLGAAGVGKSRLVHEFLDGVDHATVVRGCCLSYGEGITYWPVVEVLKQLLGAEPEQRLAGLELDSSTSRAIQAVLGDGSLVASVEEIAWAMRRLLEVVAEDAPLVVVLDDIHWGEEAFLDLVDHVAELSRGAPILLLCMARPELLDRRPGWGGGKLNATTVLLEPLAAADADILVASLLEGGLAEAGLRAKILEAAEGNPLFVEEMVAFLHDAPGGAGTVPPTIQALLAARLDQLDPAERVVLERGSIEGRMFHRGAVQALSPNEAQLVGPLTALVRKELLRPDKAQFPGEDAFRFRHLLIRDAAYDSLPKAARADLHERFATWIGNRGADLVEIDEIAGYHLERAYRYRVELGPADTAALALAERAGERLASAGGRAVARSDMRAATSLLARAVDLLPSLDPRRLSLLPTFGNALREAGQWDWAAEVLAEAVEGGLAAGERGVVANGVVALIELRLHTDSSTRHEAVRLELADAARIFEESGDEAGLARALGLAGQVRLSAGEVTSATEELERAALHAHMAGDRLQEVQILRWVCIALENGSTPVELALERLEQVHGKVEGDRGAEVRLMKCQAHLEAMRGSFDVARGLIARAKELAEQLGLQVAAAGVRCAEAELELLAGRPAAAERAIRPAVVSLAPIGDQGHFVSMVPVLADALFAEGRGEEAAPLIARAVEWAMADDMDASIGWRRSQAKLLAHRGHFENAERLAREATEMAGPTDFLDLHARALEDLAEILCLAGRPQESLVELERAIGLHEQKGNLVSAAKTRALLENLRRTTATRH